MSPTVGNAGLSALDLTAPSLKPWVASGHVLPSRMRQHHGGCPSESCRLAALPDFASVGPLDTTSHEVQFIITVSGDVTPVWKLVSVTVNPGGPFLGATRTRTDDLLITMGPLDVSASGRPLRPSRAIEDAHLAAQIQGITTAIQNQRR
jgi:hypothetical protein